jgi:hypothetical protein
MTNGVNIVKGKEKQASVSRGLVAGVCGLCVAFATTGAFAYVPGSVDQVSGWYPAGSTLTITATPEAYRDVMFGGDTNSATITATTMSFAVNGPREIDVVFKDQVTTTGVALWYLAETHPEITSWTPQLFEDVASQPSASGVSMFEAYLTGIDPNDASAVFEVDRIMKQNGRPRLQWSHATRPPRAILVQHRASLMTGAWTTLHHFDADAGVNYFEASEDLQGYYRLAVETTP